MGHITRLINIWSYIFSKKASSPRGVGAVGAMDALHPLKFSEDLLSLTHIVLSVQSSRVIRIHNHLSRISLFENNPEPEDPLKPDCTLQCCELTAVIHINCQVP